LQGKVGPALRYRLQSAQDYDTLDVTFFLQGEPAAEALAVDTVPAPSSLQEIKDRAAAGQEELIQFLTARQTEVAFTDGPISVPQARHVTSFWINNAVKAQVSRGALDEAIRRQDVVHAELARNIDVRELLDVKKAPAARKKARPRPVSAPVRAADAGPQPTWSVQRINAPLVWQLGFTGEGVLVALIDTGVNYNHPDLKNRMWDGGTAYPNHGYDFASEDLDPMDEDGHGTCTAGQVAGDGSAGKATGVAPKATVMALRVGGSEANIWKAFEFALDHGVQVISMSMSWKYPWHPDYPGWRRACETILAAGVLHANSVGNQGDDLTTYPLPYNIAAPGNCPPPRLHPLQSITGGLASPISCGATDDTDQLAGYSGRGPAAWETAPYVDYPYQNGARIGLLKPDVCAPGPGTTSCNYLYPGSAGQAYTGFGGTSAATPHVGGCLALLAEACRRAGKPIVPARIQEALENTAVRVVGQTRDKENHYGAGRVDVYAAYKYGNTRGWW
jgi:subtilisin family serine protease